MKKSFKKLLAKMSLISMLSFSPVSKATRVDVDSDVTSPVNNLNYDEEIVGQNKGQIEYERIVDHVLKKAEKPGGRFYAAGIYSIRGLMGALAAVCGTYVAVVPDQKNDVKTTKAERVMYGLAGVIGAVAAFFSFRGLANIIKGVPLIRMINDYGDFSLTGSPWEHSDYSKLLKDANKDQQNKENLETEKEVIEREQEQQ